MLEASGSVLSLSMKFSRIFLNRLQNQPIASDTVVVIDVLRSFTSAAIMLARGARAIYPVERIAEAVSLLSRVPHPVSVGAVGGGDPVPGFEEVAPRIRTSG